MPQPTEGGTIRVQGTGTVAVVPDVVRARLAVVTERRPSLEAARTEAAQAADRLIRALRKRGVEARDIQTVGLGLGPEYDFANRTRRLAGYVARQQLEVMLRSVEQVGPTLDAALAAAGDVGQLQGLQWDIDDPDAARATARSRAFARARAAAEQIASEAGVELGSVRAVVEGGGGPAIPPPSPMLRAEAASATPVEAGTLDVTVSLDVTWSTR
jgi:hypothetical protein